MGDPYITWNSNTYICVTSVAQFSRELETGGFALVKMLTATIRLFNCDGTSRFTTLPTPQQKITYSVDGLQYRIESVHTDPTKSYIRIVAEGIAKGI